MSIDSSDFDPLPDQLAPFVNGTVHEDAEGRWLTGACAESQHGVTVDHLNYVRRKGRTHSGGEPLRAKRIPLSNPIGRHREVWLYHEDDVKAVSKRLDPLPQCAKETRTPHRDSEGTWLPAGLAESDHGTDTELLRTLRNKRCPHLDGKKLRAKEIRLRTPLGRHRNLWVYHEDDVKRLAEWCRASAGGVHKDVAGRWLSRWVCREKYGVSENQLLSASQKNQCRRKKVYLRIPKFGHRHVWVYHEEDVRRLEPVEFKEHDVYQDSEGRWIATARAVRIGTSANLLRWWRGKYCPQIGDLLRAKCVLLPKSSKDERLHHKWVYHEEDVKALVRQPKPVRDGVYKDSDGTWRFGRSAQTQYAITERTLARYRKSCCYLSGGRPVRAKQVSVSFPGNQITNRWVYWEDDLKEIERKRAAHSQTGDEQDRAAAKSEPPVEPAVDVEAPAIPPATELATNGKKADRRRKASKRRSRKREPKGLTARQLEAAQIVGECKGNITEAARRMGLQRATVRQHYFGAMNKLGKKAMRHFTQALPLDKRGQASLAGDQNRP